MKFHYFAALLLFVCAPIFAQSSAGVAGISGVVKDASGASVPNAKVVISSASQGQVRSPDYQRCGAVFGAGFDSRRGLQSHGDGCRLQRLRGRQSDAGGGPEPGPECRAGGGRQHDAKWT